MLEKRHLEVARSLTERLNARDAEGVLRHYADDVAVWRNFDRRTLNKKQVTKVVGMLVSAIEGLHYEDVRVTPTVTGFVQQHVLRGRAPSGEDLSVPACLVAEIRDGLIVRVDEYLDSAAMAPLMGGKA